MEAVRWAFLKEQKEAAPTSEIPDIMDEITNKLFVKEDNKK